jgi:hypothetical protein
MTRDEAIEYILGLQDDVSSEFAISRTEVESNKARVRSALEALGVDVGQISPDAGGGAFR